MSKETILLISSSAAALLMLFLGVRLKQILEALVSFSFMQSLSWLLGALVVEAKLIEYPVNLLDYTYKASFIFEFFIFPSVSVIFNLHYPKTKSKLIQALYIFAISGAITLVEVLYEDQTKLVEYIHWTWYLSLFSIALTLLISYWYYVWFFKKIQQRYNIEKQ